MWLLRPEHIGQRLGIKDTVKPFIETVAVGRPNTVFETGGQNLEPSMKLAEERVSLTLGAALGLTFGKPLGLPLPGLFLHALCQHVPYLR